MWGNLVRDPELRYVGETVARIHKDPDTMSYIELCRIVQERLAYHTVESIRYYVLRSRTFDEGLRLIWNDANTLDFLKIWIEFKEVDIYVFHKVDEPVLVEEPLILSGPPIDSSQPVESSSAFNDTVGGTKAVGGFNDGNKVAGSEPEHVFEAKVKTKQKQVFKSDSVVESEAETEPVVETKVEIKPLLETEAEEVGDKEIEEEEDDDVYLFKVRYLSDSEDDLEL
ncbi:hypothetical protein PTKIN_Ptkin17bG0072500 [Pterospermum kingtungense]